jgi:hypothetical protein
MTPTTTPAASTTHVPGRDSGIRLAELMAALSIATDLGMGQPVEFAMTSCIVAMRLGSAAGLSDAELRDVYYESLLRYIGCNAETYWMASVLGDELAVRAEIATVDSADTMRVMSMMLRHMRQANAEKGMLQAVRAMVRGMAQMPLVATSFFPGHCEVAARLATRLANCMRAGMARGCLRSRVSRFRPRSW